MGSPPAFCIPSPDFSSHSPRFDRPAISISQPTAITSPGAHDSRYYCILPVIILVETPERPRNVQVALPARFPDLDANPPQNTPQLRTSVPSSRNRRIEQNLNNPPALGTAPPDHVSKFANIPHEPTNRTDQTTPAIGGPRHSVVDYESSSLTGSPRRYTLQCVFRPAAQPVATKNLPPDLSRT